MHPKRREENLLIKPLDEDLLVYDMLADKAHALNSTAGEVFQLCDGERTVEEMTAKVAESRKVTQPEAAALTQSALEFLSHRGLLLEKIARLDGDARLSRRRLLQGMAVAAVAVPVIVSMSAPWPAAATSCAALGNTCSGSVCCPGLYCRIVSGAVIGTCTQTLSSPSGS